MISLRSLAAPVVHAVARPLLGALCHPVRGQRRVLLACHNLLTATYVKEVWDLLRDDHRLTFRLCLKRQEETPGEAQAIRALLPLPVVSQPSANILPWDLVIMADHAGPFRQLAAPWRHDVLRISHGIGGKRLEGSDYFYGTRMRDERGRLRYSLIFESSEARQRQAAEADPELGKRVVVVGSRRADIMADAVAAARAARPVGRKPRVLLASSWGAGQLFAQFDGGLLTEAEALLDRYDFILRPHPHLLSTFRTGDDYWQRLFAAKVEAGFSLSPPTENLVTAIAAADIVLVDDLSSVALLAAMAGARVVIAPSGASAVGTGTFLSQLNDVAPTVQRREDLARVLATTTTSPWPPPALARLAAEMNSVPGQSAPLMCREIYRLLTLPQLVTVTDAAGSAFRSMTSVSTHGMYRPAVAPVAAAGVSVARTDRPTAPAFRPRA